MPAIIDVQCAKCRRRFGWCGRFVDRPACPGCGDRPPKAALEESDRLMDQRRQLWETHPQKATLEQLREQRIQAGLTLRQAAKILGVAPVELSDVELGWAPLPDELAVRMAEAYGVV